MALSRVTAPVAEPLTLREAKLHLRVDVDDENDLINDLIAAARQTCEQITHRAFITQTWDLNLDGFPWGWSNVVQTPALGADGAIWVPLAPLQSVTSVTYVDTAGVTQTWSSTLYSVDAPAGEHARPGRITPAYAQYYPIVRTVPNAVTVRFVAGYGAADDVPAGIKAAMKLFIGNWWLNREAGTLASGGRGTSDVLPFGVDTLLWPFKAI